MMEGIIAYLRCLYRINPADNNGLKIYLYRVSGEPKTHAISLPCHPLVYQ